MAYLDCSVKSCTYNNEDGCCCKGDIQVEGREATEAQSTCCGSFKDRGTNGAACNALKDVSKEIDVACEATHCRFNENEKCHADHIGISGAGACTCGETECASFECNCKYEAGFQCFKTQKLHKKFTKIPLFLLTRRCSMGVGKTKRFLFGGGTYEKKITYFTGTLHCK